MGWDMQVERRIVNNYIFLLGLDNLYREAIKQHERAELLDCARRVAAALQVTPSNGPVEGYYAEDDQLTEYFQFFRALQQVKDTRTSEVAALPEFQRLVDVSSSALYGQPQQHDKLLPVGRDALSQALIDTYPKWTVQNLTTAAYSAAHETDDISLVGLAARVKNPIVLTALRESVVLYAETVCIIEEPPPLKYVWDVDDELAKQARRFIDLFNSLFDEELPSPDQDQAERYWHACEDTEILGRCVRLGRDETQAPPKFYHWAICLKEKGLTVQEFWHPEIWTTDRYRQALKDNWQCPDL